MSTVSETAKAIFGVVGLAAIIAGMWWLVGAMLGVAYLGFRMVIG